MKRRGEVNSSVGAKTARRSTTSLVVSALRSRCSCSRVSDRRQRLRQPDSAREEGRTSTRVLPVQMGMMMIVESQRRNNER